jgi:hypothetical protein
LRKFSKVMVFAALLAVPAAARAAGQPPGGMQGQVGGQPPGGMQGPVGQPGMTGQEWKKYATAVDADLNHGLADAKVVWQFSQWPQGRADDSILRETAPNIERDIRKAQTYSNWLVRNAPAGQKEKVRTSVDEMTQHLSAASTGARKMSGMRMGNREMLKDTSSMLYRHLKAATSPSTISARTCSSPASIGSRPPSGRPCAAARRR